MSNIAIIAIRAVAFVVFCHCSFAAPLTSSEIAGTYCLDASSLHKQSVPTNFYAFTITLKADGSFIATNVPADFFFDYTPTPAVAEARGTWAVRHESEGRSLFYTGENDYLDLDFTSPPGPGAFSTPLQSSHLAPPRIYICYHSNKKDAAVFYLKRQRT